VLAYRCDQHYDYTAEADWLLLAVGEYYLHARSWKPELGARAYFFDRHTLELAADIAMPTMSMYHFINGEFNQLAALCVMVRALHSIAADHPLFEALS
jgi:carotenoid cleavage dioxygenase-like enzyme